ncbi:MAG: LysM peptidoglycan-binding domain-containing protein [Myxococcota bacterium]
MMVGRVFGAALCLASLAWAQSDDEGFGGPEGDFESEIETEELGFEPRTPPEPRTADPSDVRLGEARTVQPGDTLWDLSTQYLNNPWYWPKVWSYNPQLTNPHWIYPGNEVRFYPGDENLPTAVDVATESFDDSDLLIPGELSPDDLVRSSGPIGSAVPDSIWSAYIGYIGSDSQRFTGQVVGSFSEAVQLDDYDIIYLQMRGPVSGGDELAVYRRLREINHPVTGQFMGYAVAVIGQVRVRDSTPTVTSGIISRTFRPIERGDYVGPFPANWGQRVDPTPNQAETNGYIVETTEDLLVLVGEHHYVYIDRGRRDGVQIGNRFQVIQRGDGFTRDVNGFPYEEVGTVMVIDVQETGSTGLVVESVRSLSVGDRIAMRAE